MSLAVTREDVGGTGVLLASLVYKSPSKRGWALLGGLIVALAAVCAVWPSWTTVNLLVDALAFVAGILIVKFGLEPLNVRVTATDRDIRVERRVGARVRSVQSLPISSGFDFGLGRRRRLLGMDVFPGDSIRYGGATVQIPVPFRAHASQLCDALNALLQHTWASR